jgi:thiol-disulfide isomerase/thioredoxin
MLANDDLHPFPATWAGGFEIIDIRYGVSFADDTFAVTAPPGAKDVSAPPPSPEGSPSAPAREDPFDYVSLARGEPAQDWTGTTLDGSAFRISDSKGHPVLVLLFPDWCPPGDPVCDVLPAFQAAHERWGDVVDLVWVDLQGTQTQAQRVVRANGYTFPAVLSTTVEEAWGVRGYPVWVLLDADGRTVDVRIEPQSTDELGDLLAEVG